MQPLHGEGNVKTVEQIREEIAGVDKLLQDLYEGTNCDLDHHGYCQAHGWLTKGICPQFRLRSLIEKGGILAIEVGGEVVEECDKCSGDKEWYSTGDNIWVDCKTCHGTGKLTRPKTLKDLLEGK